MVKSAKESLLNLLMNLHREFNNKDITEVRFNGSSFSSTYKNMKDEK